MTTKKLVTSQGKTKILNKLASTDELKIIGFAPEEWLCLKEVTIHTTKLIIIKIALKKIHKRWVLYTLLELYAIH